MVEQRAEKPWVSDWVSIALSACCLQVLHGKKKYSSIVSKLAPCDSNWNCILITIEFQEHFLATCEVACSGRPGHGDAATAAVHRFGEFILSVPPSICLLSSQMCVEHLP